MRPDTPTGLLESATLRWVRIDLGAEGLSGRLEGWIGTWLDHGVEVVGCVGTPDLLAVRGWEAGLRRILDAGFRGAACTAFPVLPDAAQAALLARCEEVWLMPGADPEGPRRLRHAALEEGMHPPLFHELPAPMHPELRPEGATRVCLDPWEGLVLGPRGETHPCAADSTSLGAHREVPLESLLEGSDLRARREALLCGVLPEACLRCPNRPWGSPQDLRQRVAAHASLLPTPLPGLSSQELAVLFRHWAKGGERLLLYPAGAHTGWLLEFAPAIAAHLVALGDRDPAKQRLNVLGLPVWDPAEITRERVDRVILVAGPKEEAIRASLAPLEARGVAISSAHGLAKAWRLARGEALRSMATTPS